MEKQFRFLFIPIFLFLCFFLFAGYLNRFASDDFEFLSKYRDLGFTGSIAYFYHHWNTRWLAIGFMNIVFSVTFFTGSLLWYHCVSIALLWFAMYRICAQILTFSVKHLLITSGFGMVCFFYCCFSIPDVFFWVNTSTMYLFGTIAFLFALSELINKKQTVLSYVVLISSGFYLGGAYEPLVFTSMVAMVCYLSFTFYTKGFVVFWKPPVVKSIIFLSVLMIAFAISYSGEGHVVRASFLPQNTAGFKLWVLVKAFIKMLAIYLPLKFLTALPLSLPWFLVGKHLSFVRLNSGIVLYAFVVLLVLIVISFAPIAFLMSEMGPERAWTQVSVYITFFAAIFAAWLGAEYGKKINFSNSTHVATIVICLMIIANGVFATKQDAAYSRAADERMMLLSKYQKEGRTGIMSVPALPSSVWLHSGEIDENPEHFTNKHLKKYMQLDFDIRKDTANLK